MNDCSLYSESLLSIDSLEDEHNFKSSTIINHSSNYMLENNNRNKEISHNVDTQKLKKEYQKWATQTAHSNLKEDDFNSIKGQTELAGNTNIESAGSFSGFSYYSYNEPHQIKSAWINSMQRLSRKKPQTLTNITSVRPRHRSVSYLEQFRKKILKSNKTHSSSFSTAGSEPTEPVKISSYDSFVTSGSSLDPSEFELYEDLLSTDKRDEERILSKQIEPPCGSGSSIKSKKVQQSKMKKERVVLSKIHASKEEHERLELDKRKALEKREAYGNKVKIRNQIKIIRQKEQEKINKIAHESNIISKIDIYKQEFPMKTKICKGNKNLRDEILIPFTASCADSIINSKKKLPSKKQVKNAGKQEKSLHEDLDNTSNPEKKSELTKMQKRHENEKCLVDSIRNIILQA